MVLCGVLFISATTPVIAANTPGDYVIRRNDAETDAVTGSNLDMTWDTSVASIGSSISYSAGTYTLASGKYLILWSERIDFDTSNTTNNRRGEVQGQLVIGGTATTTGAGQTYYRNADNNCGTDCQWQNVLSGAGIVDIPSDSTSLVTRVYRTDSSTGVITSNRVADWGGVSILALDDSWDYARYSLNADTTTVDAFSDVVWSRTNEEDTGFSRSSGEITITNAGRYLVALTIPITNTAGGGRTEFVTRLTLDDVEVTGTRSSTYIRTSQSTNDGAISYVGVVDVAANDVLAVEMDMTDGTVTSNNMLEGASIQIVELPSGAETFIAESTAIGNMNATSISEFTWETTAHIDTGSFTDVTAGDTVIETAIDDDFLLFATQATDNGPARSTATGRFSINDTLITHGAGGQYNRSSGADDAGFSFGALVTGLSSGDDISLENVGIAQATGNQTCDYCAMSGISLSTLFPASGDPTLTQSGYRWFENTDSVLAGRAGGYNTPVIEPADGTPMRLRMLLDVGTAEIGASGTTTKLQFAERSGTCDAGFVGESYSDVETGSGDIRFYDNPTPADGDNLTAHTNDPRSPNSSNVVAQDYEESNNVTNSVAVIPAGESGLWDFSLVSASTFPGTTYCLRMVQSGGGLLNSYSVIPEFTTAAPLKVRLKGTVRMRRVRLR